MSLNGLHTSLYAQYPPDVARHVENAIWLKISGQSAAARLLYNHELSFYWNEPLIAIERADLELECGRWGRAWRILDAALTNSRAVKADLDLPEYRLLSLARAMFGIRHRGDVGCVPAELERTWKWLETVPPSAYTDLQASCIRRYVVAYLLLRLSTSYQNDKLEHIPMDVDRDSSQAAVPWNGLHLLRRSLTSRGLFNEANAVFRPELNRTPPQDRQPFIQQFLDDITSASTLRHRHFIESVVRLQWSDTHVQLHNAAGALEELAKAEAACNKWREELGITEAFCVPQFQAILAQKLELCGDHGKRLQLAEQCIAIFEQLGSAKLGACISNATDSAYAEYGSTGAESYLKKFFALHQKLEDYDERVTEDLCDLVRHRSSLISVTITNLVDRQKSLEWISGFFDRYPYFQCPGELEQLYRQQSLLLIGLQRLDEAQEAEDLADRLKNSGPLIGKWLHMSSSRTQSTLAPVSTKYDSEDDEDVFFYSLFPISKLKDPAQTIATVVEYILDWLVDDVKGGKLEESTIQMLLGIRKRDMAHAVEQTPEEIRLKGRANLLSALIPGSPGNILPHGETRSTLYSWLSRLLFGLIPGSLDNILPHAETRSTLYGWLSRPPKGQRNKRLFCLILLRNSRQYLLSDDSACDLRIAELEDILELETNLPHQVREVCSSAFRNAHAHLAGTYFAKLGESPDLRSNSIYETLLEAERYCDQSIAKLRNIQPDLLASQLRLSARISLTKIRRLELQLADLKVQTSRPVVARSDTHSTEQPSEEKINEQILNLRQSGLIRIREAQQIYTTSELLSSWLDDLDGVYQRQRLSRFQLTAYTAFVAVNLLLSEPGKSPSTETVEECWQWVQKYKARSLTQTISLRIPVPKELEDRILKSDDARPLYQEMLALQAQIDSVEQSSRFDLRRRMDKLRERMKQDPLLEMIIALREGSPLTLTDVAAIEEDAAKPVVFVDWFYFPRYPNESKGNFLLFTARATGKMTLDVLSTSFEELSSWAIKYFNPKQMRFMEAREQFDTSLGSLVAPLAHRTEEGELLIFCPSSTLHLLPIHALRIHDPETETTETLIRRNPIVYIHAHSLLRACFSATQSARHSLMPLEPQIFSGIPKADIINGRFEAGRESVAAIASLLNITPMIDESALKSGFCRQATRSRLLHIHTHCKFDLANPLDHHFTFPRLSGHHGEDAEYKLTAKELFNIRINPGMHINLVACSGGVTEIQLGDEVMGLVPAFLYSGASSTVSTLWPIQDDDGAAFSRGFFDDFVKQYAEQCENVPSGSGVEDEMQSLSLDANAGRTERKRALIVDIALAVQNAITQMDEGQDEPLSKWAGFVLHGYWRFSLRREDLPLPLSNH